MFYAISNTIAALYSWILICIITNTCYSTRKLNFWRLECVNINAKTNRGDEIMNNEIINDEKPDFREILLMCIAFLNIIGLWLVAYGYTSSLMEYCDPDYVFNFSGIFITFFMSLYPTIFLFYIGEKILSKFRVQTSAVLINFKGQDGPARYIEKYRFKRITLIVISIVVLLFMFPLNGELNLVKIIAIFISLMAAINNPFFEYELGMTSVIKEFELKYHIAYNCFFSTAIIMNIVGLARETNCFDWVCQLFTCVTNMLMTVISVITNPPLFLVILLFICFIKTIMNNK